jgi:hypothetical protein
VLALLRRGAERGEVRPAAVLPVVAAVAPMLVMGFFLLRGEPATDQELVEIVDEVMLPLCAWPGQPGGRCARTCALSPAVSCRSCARRTPRRDHSNRSG